MKGKLIEKPHYENKVRRDDEKKRSSVEIPPCVCTFLHASMFKRRCFFRNPMQTTLRAPMN